MVRAICRIPKFRQQQAKGHITEPRDSVDKRKSSPKKKIGFRGWKVLKTKKDDHF